MEVTHPHPVPNNLPVLSNPPVPSNPPTHQDQDVLTRLLYDGRRNWFVFKGKLEQYAKINGWLEVVPWSYPPLCRGVSMLPIRK
ncbi:hypothetical protein DPMN_178309 [Dreissena polymorpha]|uniref:Uncharacterized protein n=1 Tax=Dreissena polymorpha TaxID=45954 RepID=A0A9D4ECK6_DREPO|nr:hypothetical protein DPMN_178309 [Dreissena polymorpha]